MRSLKKNDPDSLFHIFLFFTWDVSLSLWKEKGLFEREVRYYESLAKRGIRVTLLTWGDERDLDFKSELHRNIEVIPAYKYIPCPKSKAVRAFMSPLVLWYIRKYIYSADLLKTNQMWGAWCAVLAKYFFKKPLLVRTGFELYRFTKAQGHGFLRSLFIYLLSKAVYSSANKIYLATQEDKDFVSDKFKVAEGLISVRPNWIDVDVFKPLDIQQEDKSILFVGRLNEQKNIPLLLKAIVGMDVTLYIIGDGETKKDIVKLVENSNLSVKFLGSIPNIKLPELYNKYQIFVLPSFYEGNPKTLLEAMSCGSAVIGTNVDGINSVIEHAETGMLCDENESDLREKISNLIKDRSLRKSLGVASRKQIMVTQSLDILLDKEIADYPELQN